MLQLQFDRYEPVWRWKKYPYPSATQLSAAYTAVSEDTSQSFFPCWYGHRWLIYSGIQARDEPAYYTKKLGEI
jgi:hypothetical protein